MPYTRRCPRTGQMSAALKNALDWGSTEAVFKGKAGALVGAGGGCGSARAQLAIRQSAVYLDLTLVNGPEVTIPRFAEKVFDDATGDLADAAWADRVRDITDRLVALATATRELRRK